MQSQCRAQAEFWDIVWGEQVVHVVYGLADGSLTKRPRLTKAGTSS